MRHRVTQWQGMKWASACCPCPWMNAYCAGPWFRIQPVLLEPLALLLFLVPIIFAALFRGKTVICAYSIEDIDHAFSTSKLKGYSSPLTGNRPGMVRKTKFVLLLSPRHWKIKKSSKKEKWVAVWVISVVRKKNGDDIWKPRVNKREAILKSLSGAHCLFKSAEEPEFSSLLPTVCPQKLDYRRSERHQEPRRDQIPPRDRGRDPTGRRGPARPAHRRPNHTHRGGHRAGGQRRALQRSVPRNRCVRMLFCLEPLVLFVLCCRATLFHAGLFHPVIVFICLHSLLAEALKRKHQHVQHRKEVFSQPVFGS